jgi:hypothetical protein
MSPPLKTSEHDAVLIALGEIRGDIKGIDKRIDRVEGSMDVFVTECREMGQHIALLTNAGERREKKISELAKRVDHTENTGVHHIIAQKTAWGTIKIVAAICVGLLGAAATGLTIYSNMAKPAHVGARK